MRARLSDSVYARLEVRQDGIGPGVHGTDAYDPIGKVRYWLTAAGWRMAAHKMAQNCSIDTAVGWTVTQGYYKHKRERKAVDGKAQVA